MTRINNTLLGPAEKRALHFLASRTPGWIGPNGLTFIGIMGAVFVFIGYALSSINHHLLWLAVFGWVVNWYGDSLDGSLARYRKIEKPHFGFFIDHLSDTISILIIGLGFGLSPYVRFDLALLLIIAYFMLSIQTYVLDCATGVFEISYTKLGATEFRLMAIIFSFILYLFKFPDITIRQQIVSVIDLLAMIPLSVMVILFINAFLKNAVRLYREDNHKASGPT
jgi:archaetidylinositol phosphate synthase